MLDLECYKKKKKVQIDSDLIEKEKNIEYISVAKKLRCFCLVTQGYA